MQKPLDPSPRAAIEARGLTKTYAGFRKAPPKTALKRLDLVVPAGSMFGLLGPNGAGKSTFINILAGLVVKSGGEAFVWGHEVSRAPREAKAAIGVVPQEITADPFFTPFETLELHAGFYGVPKAERRTMEILDAVGLTDKKDAYVRTLSGGMKRRLMVAKALVHSPPVIVLDEPTAGVDVDLRRQLWDYVRRLNASGVTVVLTTHYLEEAQELCDTIAIINQGALVACEPTGQILKRLDGKTLVITPQVALGAPPATLQGLEGVETAVRPGGELAVSYRAGQRSIEEVLARVTAAGIAIKDLRTEEADLEDVFVALTTG
jgi:ABC-2 type transport system ATP-binding protein